MNKLPVDKNLLKALKNMPTGLAHSVKDVPKFDIRESEVIKWMLTQDGILQWMFDSVRGRRLIVFDDATRTWGPAADELKAERPVYLTAEKALEVLSDEGGIGYYEWRAACEERTGHKFDYWEFWHIIKRLKDEGRVIKVRSAWHCGDLDFMIKREHEALEDMRLKLIDEKDMEVRKHLAVGIGRCTDRIGELEDQKSKKAGRHDPNPLHA